MFVIHGMADRVVLRFDWALGSNTLMSMNAFSNLPSGQKYWLSDKNDSPESGGRCGSVVDLDRLQLVASVAIMSLHFIMPDSWEACSLTMASQGAK